MPAIPSTSIVLHRRHPSRLPFGSRRLADAHCRSLLTGPVADAKNLFPLRREWQALAWQARLAVPRQTGGRSCR